MLYCRQFNFQSSIISKIEKTKVTKGELYIALSEDDLVNLLDEVYLLALEPGVDIGIISYNETPIKKYLMNGITTISTDFKLLGKIAAELVLDNSQRSIEVPFYLTLRGSL